MLMGFVSDSPDLSTAASSEASYPLRCTPAHTRSDTICMHGSILVHVTFKNTLINMLYNG